jgi:hypothetical protein
MVLHFKLMYNLKKLRLNGNPNSSPNCVHFSTVSPWLDYLFLIRTHPKWTHLTYFSERMLGPQLVPISRGTHITQTILLQGQNTTKYEKNI